MPELGSGALLVAALAVAAVTSMRIGLGAGDRTQLVWVFALLGVLALCCRRAATRGGAASLGLVAGVTILAEGIAVGWLGHQHGYLQILVGSMICAMHVLRTGRRRDGSSAVRLAIGLAAATGVLAAGIGLGGLYLSAATNAGGFDCLSGFAGDPGRFPGVPPEPSAITTSFSWAPIGRACTFDTAAGVVTLVQTSARTTTWVWLTGIAGGVLAVAGALLAAIERRSRTSSDAPGDPV